MINKKKAKSMNFIIKKLILLLITISFFDYFKNVNPNLQIFASDSTGINIWPAEELLAYFIYKNKTLF